MNLSPHFTLEEFLASQTAIRRGIANDPDEGQLVNLRMTADNMERVRNLLGGPIVVSSGFRSPDLNSAIGGSKTSYHCLGLAVDFVCPRHGGPYDVAQTIASSGVLFDQLIYEGTWVHIGFPKLSDPPRRQILTARFPGPVYHVGIVP